MKKKQLKNYLKPIILLLGISLLLWNCEKEEQEQYKKPLKKTNNFSITEIGAKEIQQNTKLKEKLNLFSRKNKLKGKNVYSFNNDFIINTNHVKFIESIDKKYHSYTFHLQEINKNKFPKNLLISLQKNGKYKATLITYQFSKEEIELYLKGVLLDFKGKIKQTPVKDNGLISRLLSKSQQKLCITIAIASCTQGNHIAGRLENGMKCPAYDLDIIEICDDGTEGGGSTDDGYYNDNNNDDNNNDDGLNGGKGEKGEKGEKGDEDDIITTPILDEFPDDPDCEKIKKYEDDTEIKESLNIIKIISDNDSVKKEAGMFLKKTDTGWGASSVTGTDENPYINIRLASDVKIDMFVHTHFKDLLSIFSPGDLQMYYNLLNKGHAANGTNLMFILLTNAGTKYAFSVNDLTKFNAFAQKHLLTTESLNKFADESFDGINKKNTNDENEKAFLKMMKNEDLGISLFKANNDFSEWQVLTLDINNNVVPKDCE